MVDDKECSRRAEEAKARSEPHFYMMEMAPGEQGGRGWGSRGGIQIMLQTAKLQLVGGPALTFRA